jgi:hypothetical protein
MSASTSMSISTSISTSISPTDAFIDLTCEYCDIKYVFDNITELNEHLEHVHFVCSLCKKAVKCESEIVLLRHLRSKHPGAFMNK